MESKLKVFGLSVSRELAEATVREMGIALGEVEIKTFSDGEIYERVLESIRGDDVFVISSISGEANDSFMEIMILIDALRRASARTINVVIPYYGYGRSDRKAKAREAITAKLIASLLEMNGVDRAVSIDFHADQIQGFFNIPVDLLRAAPLLAEYFVAHDLTENLVVVSPDHTGAGRARRFAEFLDAPWGVVNDHVAKTNPSSSDAIVGDVAGRRAIIIDDIIDTGERMAITAKALHENGATDVYVVATHAVFSKRAGARLATDENVTKIIVTDTNAITPENQSDKLDVLSVAPVLARAIHDIHEEISLDKLRIAQNDPDTFHLNKKQ